MERKGGPRMKKSEELEKDWSSKVLDLARVTRVVGGGKRFKFRATVAIGNQAGKVGVGVAKGDDVAQSVEKGIRAAKKEVISVIFKGDSIPHEVEAKYKSAQVLIKPAAKGAGVIAGGALRVILGLAGVKNVTAKILSRSTNKLNNARAAIDALKKLKQPKLEK